MKQNQVEILLIEDNPDEAELAIRSLKKNSLANNLVHIDDGAEALEYIEKNPPPPSLIFLDLNMPVMDGFGFLEEFEKLDETVRNHCHVVVLSSSISAEDINRASTNPYVTRYVNKPLSEKYLDAIHFE